MKALIEKTIENLDKIQKEFADEMDKYQVASFEDAKTALGFCKIVQKYRKQYS